MSRVHPDDYLVIDFAELVREANELWEEKHPSPAPKVKKGRRRSSLSADTRIGAERTQSLSPNTEDK